MCNFRNLWNWKKSMELVTKVFKTTSRFPIEELFGLTSQIRGSAISIPSYIAEGFGRDSNKEYLRYLNISISSLFEFQTQLEISMNINHLNKVEFDLVYENSREIERMLVSFIKKIKERE